MQLARGSNEVFNANDFSFRFAATSFNSDKWR